MNVNINISSGMTQAHTHNQKLSTYKNANKSCTYTFFPKKEFNLWSLNKEDNVLCKCNIPFN